MQLSVFAPCTPQSAATSSAIFYAAAWLGIPLLQVKTKIRGKQHNYHLAIDYIFFFFLTCMSTCDVRTDPGPKVRIGRSKEKEWNMDTSCGDQRSDWHAMKWTTSELWERNNQMFGPYPNWPPPLGSVSQLSLEFSGANLSLCLRCCRDKMQKHSNRKKRGGRGGVLLLTRTLTEMCISMIHFLFQIASVTTQPEVSNMVP